MKVMNSFFISVNAVLPIVITAGIGAFIRQKKLLSDKTFSEMNKLCFKLFLPALLFYNVYTSTFSMSYVRLLVFAVASIVIGFLALTVIVPLFVKEPRRQGVVIQAIYRGNYILLGVPVATVICGEGNIGPVALAASIIVPLFNFLAVITLSFHNEEKGKVDWRSVVLNILKNPLIGSSVLGLVFVFLGINLPQFVLTTIRDLSRVATPLSILVLGGSLALEKAIVNRKILIIGSFCRLVVMPFIAVAIAVFMGFRGAELVAILMIFASPTAVSSFVMAEQMGADGELAGEFVIATSVASAATMFLWIFTLSSLGLV